jgi:rhodanese-related sulfurtransferase
LSYHYAVTEDELTISNQYKNMSKNKVTVVDVRTPAEFMGGHVAGSINIPLQEIQHRLDEIKSLEQPIVLCCASGNRSGQAAMFLKSQGVACENGGSWLDVNYRYSSN